MGPPGRDSMAQDASPLDSSKIRAKSQRGDLHRKSRPEPRSNREVIAGRLDLDLARERIAIEQIQEWPMRHLRQMLSQQKADDPHPIFFRVGERQGVRDLLFLVNTA